MILTGNYSETKTALMLAVHDFMEDMIVNLNAQYQGTELDNVLMMPNAPKIKEEQVLYGFVFSNQRPSDMDMMNMEMRFMVS